MKNYFTLLNLSPSFALDEAALQRAYLQLQQQHHPDRQAGRSGEERRRAMLLSMDINQAYATLKNPVKRAQHLLALEGINVNTEQDSVKPDPELLMEVMEWREALEESFSHEELEGLRRRMAEERGGALKALAAAFAERKPEEAAKLTIRLNYIEKFACDVNARLHRLEGIHEPAATA